MERSATRMQMGFSGSDHAGTFEQARKLGENVKCELTILSQCGCGSSGKSRMDIIRFYCARVNNYVNNCSVLEIHVCDVILDIAVQH